MVNPAIVNSQNNKGELGSGSAKADRFDGAKAGIEGITVERVRTSDDVQHAAERIQPVASK